MQDIDLDTLDLFSQNSVGNAILSSHPVLCTYLGESSGEISPGVFFQSLSSAIGLMALQRRAYQGKGLNNLMARLSIHVCLFLRS
jgi:hypothetical protein